ncbi:MAG: Maf family protein [Acutalibacteraceae bacterium]
MGLWALRLQFTTENPGEIDKILMDYQGRAAFDAGSYTRGSTRAAWNKPKAARTIASVRFGGGVRRCPNKEERSMIIFASQSPRRQELMKLTGLPFTVRVADVDETMDPPLPAQQEVARVSRLKARTIAASAAPDDIVIAADTIVVIDGREPRQAAYASGTRSTCSGFSPAGRMRS